MAPGAHSVPELTLCMVGKGVYPATQVKWRGLNRSSPEQWRKQGRCPCACLQVRRHLLEKKCNQSPSSVLWREDTHPAPSPTLG